MNRFQQLETFVRQKDHLIEKSEEIECAIAAKNGDASAFKRLMLANLHHVMNLAHMHRRYGDVEDLFSIGVIALCNTFNRFDPTRCCRFITFARFEIIARMRDYTQLKAGGITGGLGTKRLRRMFFRFRRDSAVLRAKGLDNRRVMEVLAVEYGTTVANLEKVVVLQSNLVTSIDMPYHPFESSSNEEVCLLDSIRSNEPQVDEEIDHIENEKSTCLKIHSAMRVLNNREKMIIHSRYLIADDEKKASLQSLGEQFGLSKERVRQIEVIAIEKLKNFLTNTPKQKPRRSRAVHHATA